MFLLRTIAHRWVGIRNSWSSTLSRSNTMLELRNTKELWEGRWTDLRMIFRALLVFVILAAVPALNAQPVEVDLGGLILTVSDSSTAQIFHIVDQLSEWDPYAHKQYGRWARTLPLNQEDRRLLQQHADLRRARGRGEGFEQAFLVAEIRSRRRQPRLSRQVCCRWTKPRPNGQSSAILPQSSPR
jgi:hypothetical protein